MVIILLLFSVSIKAIPATYGNGSISVLYQGRTKEDRKIALSKAEFKLYKVGEDKNGVWKLNNQFEKSNVSMEENDAESRQKQAVSLYQYGKKHNLKGENKQTNQEGRLVFDQLENGLYLVAQTKEVNYGKTESYISDPFLVSIPADVDGTLLYHVTAQPKSAWESDKKVPVSEVKKEKVPKKDKKQPKNSIFTKVVKTGDFKDPVLWIMAVTLSGCIVVIYRLFKMQNRRKSKKEKDFY